jgi:hypothetical protein
MVWFLVVCIISTLYDDQRHDFDAWRKKALPMILCIQKLYHEPGKPAVVVAALTLAWFSVKLAL